MGVVKTWNGIARASVKTFDGIAVASVKTINGYDATTGGGASYTLQETFGADSSDSPNIADSGVRKYVTGKCTPSSSYTLTRYELRMKRNGAGTAPDLVGKLYGDNGSGTAPNSRLATRPNTIAAIIPHAPGRLTAAIRYLAPMRQRGIQPGLARGT